MCTKPWRAASRMVAVHSIIMSSSSNNDSDNKSSRISLLTVTNENNNEGVIVNNLLPSINMTSETGSKQPEVFVTTKFPSSSSSSSNLISFVHCPIS